MYPIKEIKYKNLTIIMIVINRCGAQQYFGPAPFIRWGPKAQAEEGYGPDAVMQVQHSIGIQSRTIQSSASPKSPRKKG